MKDAELLANERSEGGELIVEMNLLFDRKDWGMKSAVGELSLKTNSGIDNRNGTLFPDAVIFADEDKSETLMGWEFKMPDVSINDSELYSNALDKANRMGTQVFVLWNFQYAAVYIRDQKSGSWPLTPTKFFDEYKGLMKDRPSVHANSDLWKKQLVDVLNYLNGELIASKFEAAPIEFNIASYVSTIADKLAPTVANEYLKSTDTLLMPWMKRWRSKEQAELADVRGDSDKTVANAFSRNVVIGWVNRLIFAHLLKQDQNLINEALVKFSNNADILELSESLNNAVETTDFYTILHVGEYEDLLPKRVVDNLNEFNVYLAYTDFSNMSGDFVSKLLESVVSVTVRELMGLYTTPAPLAELLVGLTVTDATGEFADVTTGSGTIAHAIQNLLRRYHDEAYVHDHVWASDRYSYPLQIANLNLTTPDSLNMKNIVFRHNALSLKVGETIEIVDPATGENTELGLPKFDYIISNLPFVQSNDRNDDDQVYVNNVLKQYAELDDKTDLYQALILQLETILRNDENARIGVITSNSWMRVQKNYKSFFKTMADIYDVEMIIQPSAGRWFQNADVMTTVIILKRQGESKNPKTRLVMLKSGLTATDGYREKLPDLIDDIKLGDNNPLYTDRILRKSDILQRINLGMSVEAMFDNTDWIAALEDKLVPMTNYLEGGRGTRTGGDSIFIMKDNEVDDACSVPYLKTLKDVQSYEIRKSDYYYFFTRDSLKELASKKMNKTLAYIESVKNGKTGLSRQDNKRDKWFHADQDPQYADFVTSMNPNDRFFWGRMNPRSAVNQRVTAFRVRDEFKKEIDLIHALLNSLPDLFMLAASGFGRGQGATDFTKDGIIQISILNIELISEEDKAEIVRLWKNLKEKPVMPIKEQLNDPEWTVFNKQIFSVYGLEDDVYELMKDSLLAMIERRLSANKVEG